jgi:multiple sugar transport system substrate-binding protein
MRNTAHRAIAVTAGIASLALLAGCTSGTAKPAATTAGHVTIDYWGWEPDVTPQVVAAFNASQDDVTVNYVVQASNTATQTNFRNVMESGKGVPCLVTGFSPLSTSLVNGWAEEISDYVEPVADKFSSGARAAAQLDGEYYGLPTGADAQFMVVNQATLAANGVKAPTTWEELVETGKAIAPSGAKIINLAGEDPSTLVNLSQQAGAEWFAIDGDSWTVNLHDDATKKAASILQEIVDNDLNSTQTYSDRPALYSYFDSGQLATLPTQWWSLTGLQTNFVNSLGQWDAVPLPQFEGADDFVTSGAPFPAIVPKGCENPEAAVAYWTFAQTNPEGIAASKNTTTGAVNVPVALPDVSEYTEAVVPDKLFKQTPADVGSVIADAQASSIGAFEKGPDYDAWFPELQDQWGKFVAKQITLDEALTNVETFIGEDLKSKGISYSIAK